MYQNYFESFLSIDECNSILAELNKARFGHLPQKLLGLNDSTDQTNLVYNSVRSPGVQYCYLASKAIQKINKLGANRLKNYTAHNWTHGINKVCLPLFSYKKGAFIKAHRGRDIGFGSNDLVAVAMITQYGKDFEGGQFYLNPKASASLDGKNVQNDHEEDRMYFNLSQGSVIIFENPKMVHGTLPTTMGNRVTVSWRIST